MYLRTRFKERRVCQMTGRSLALCVASSGHGQASDSVSVCIIQVRAQLGGPGFAVSGRSATSNSLLAQAPTFQPTRGTPRPQMICRLSANPHHIAFRGGAASAVSGGRALVGCQCLSLVWDGSLAAPPSKVAAGRRSALVLYKPHRDTCHLFAPHWRRCRMARRVGQIVRRGSCTWLVRVYTGRDLETKRRTYLNQTIHGGLRDCPGSSQQNAGRPRPRAKAQLVEANALGPEALDVTSIRKAKHGRSE
jgi:hypothetical protein